METIEKGHITDRDDDALGKTRDQCNRPYQVDQPGRAGENVKTDSTNKLYFNQIKTNVVL